MSPQANKFTLVGGEFRGFETEKGPPAKKSYNVSILRPL